MADLAGDLGALSFAGWHFLRPGGDPEPSVPTAGASSVAPEPAAAPASPPTGATTVSEVDGMTLVYVPAGEFLMGAGDDDPAAFDDEKPQGRVHLDAYWIERTEVTNAQFAQFVEATGYDAGSEWQNAAVGKEQHPGILVSWNDAYAYGDWAGRQLPTEAEWEKAARGTDGRKYPWGNDAPDGTRCNYGMNEGSTTPLGKYSPSGDSPYGRADTAGNVREWVADWYDERYHASAPFRNPTGATSGRRSILRGGSWFDDAEDLRSSARYDADPTRRHGDVGFRCARDS